MVRYYLAALRAQTLKLLAALKQRRAKRTAKHRIERTGDKIKRKGEDVKRKAEDIKRDDLRDDLL